MKAKGKSIGYMFHRSFSLVFGEIDPYLHFHNIYEDIDNEPWHVLYAQIAWNLGNRKRGQPWDV